MPLTSSFSRLIPRSPNVPTTDFDRTSTSSKKTNSSLRRSMSAEPVGFTPNKQNRDRLSKTLHHLSFGSLLGRPKTTSENGQNAPQGKEGMATKSSSTKHSCTQLPSWVEEEDEYEVDDEEIRMPSELGSPASVGGFNRSAEHNVLEYRDSEETYRDDDEESLVEIRPPSGLGAIKLTVNQHPGNGVRIKSTYPSFYLEFVKGPKRIRDMKSSFSITSIAQPPNFSALLVDVLPILANYLESESLVTLTLIDKAVGKQAKKLLWRRLSVSLKVSSKGLKIDGKLPSGVTSMLSSAHLTPLVECMDLKCKFDSYIQQPRSSSSRLRPPPLILVPKAPNATRTGETIIISGSVAAQSTTSPPPQEEVIPSLPGASLKPSYPHRRQSLLHRTKSIGAGVVPEALKASAAKLSKRFSQLTVRPLEDTSNTLTVNDANHVNGNASPGPSSSTASTPSRAFHLPSRIQESGWTPPAEWERVQSPEPNQVYGTVFSTDSVNGTRPLKHHTVSSLSLQPLGLSRTLSPAVKSGLELPRQITNAQTESDLRPSPSLPILRHATGSVNSPDQLLQANRWPITLSDIACEGQSQTTPHTPQSAVSLSAFPLPPSTTTTPGKCGTAGVGHFSFGVECDNGMSLKEDMAEKERTTQEESHSRKESIESTVGYAIGEDVKKIFKALGNLERLKMEYIFEDKASSSLLTRANESLAQLLEDAHSLERLTIICPPSHKEVCEAQWTELTCSHSLKFLQVIVDSA